MERTHILFDLDGTLTDPMVGITKSVQHALSSYGIQEPDLRALCPFIGPPLKESFMKYYGFSQEKAQEAIGRYREYFADKGIFENRVYEGIPQMLDRLKDRGCRLFVATSKPEVQALRVLEHFELAGYFEHICGAPLGNEDGARKADVVRRALGYAEDASSVVMVGDRRHDVEGARENGIPCIGVLYGYGSREELAVAGASFITEDLVGLKKLLL